MNDPECFQLAMEKIDGYISSLDLASLNTLAKKYAGRGHRLLGAEHRRHQKGKQLLKRGFGSGGFAQQTLCGMSLLAFELHLCA